MIEDFARIIPDELLDVSGSVFYSGRNAFGSASPLYVLGLNPGGNPEAKSQETLAKHTYKVLNLEPADWSAYRDESWRNSPPGTSGMQPRVLHMMRRIGRNPGDIPASNVVFVRSRREASLNEFERLAGTCWQFHEAAIQHLRPRVVLCFGSTAGRYVRRKLRASRQVAEFVERNARKWRSFSFQNPDGIVVITATHPSIADWTAPATDPSQLVLDALVA
jgi:hypothetical protein